MGIRRNFEYIYNAFKNEGCLLLEIEFINSKHKMRYICSCGNESLICWNNFQQGYRCANCGGNKKLSQEYVNQTFLDAGCECLDIYKNMDTPLKYKCVCGNISKITFGNFKKGVRCLNCRNKNNSGINNNKWNPNREQIKLNKKIRTFSRSLIHNCLKSIKIKKESKTEELLGYNIKQLLEHLQTDPNFNEWKNDSYNWHIDHIIPVKAFIENNIINLNIINSLDNLRIISREENFKKSDNYIQEEFENYIKKVKCNVR